MVYCRPNNYSNMNLGELTNSASYFLEHLELTFLDNNRSSNESRYIVKDYFNFRQVIRELDRVPYLQHFTDSIKESKAFTIPEPSVVLSVNEKVELEKAISNLRSAILGLKAYYDNTTPNSDAILRVKLPETNSFDDLIKYSELLKKGIEIPVNESNEDSKVKILNGQPGSIWLILSIGSSIMLIAKLCNAAAVIRRKWAESSIFEEHAKSLKLKNELMDDLVKANKKMLADVLDAEAANIHNGHYNPNDPEVKERIKLAIRSISELIDKGGQLLPSGSNKDISNNFPDYNALNSAVYIIKQIGTGSSDEGLKS